MVAPGIEVPVVPVVNEGLSAEGPCGLLTGVVAVIEAELAAPQQGLADAQKGV